jgi:hypothetical protein
MNAKTRKFLYHFFWLLFCFYYVSLNIKNGFQDIYDYVITGLLIIISVIHNNQIYELTKED